MKITPWFLLFASISFLVLPGCQRYYAVEFDRPAELAQADFDSRLEQLRERALQVQGVDRISIVNEPGQPVSLMVVLKARYVTEDVKPQVDAIMEELGFETQPISVRLIEGADA